MQCVARLFLSIICLKSWSCSSAEGAGIVLVARQARNRMKSHFALRALLLIRMWSSWLLTLAAKHVENFSFIIAKGQSLKRKWMLCKEVFSQVISHLKLKNTQLVQTDLTLRHSPTNWILRGMCRTWGKGEGNRRHWLPSWNIFHPEAHLHPQLISWALQPLIDFTLPANYSSHLK